MHLALATENGLVRITVLFQNERWILLPKLLQCRREFHLVLAVTRADDNGENRRRRGKRDKPGRRRLARGERAAGLRLVELAERHRLAFFRRRDLALLAAHHSIEARDASRLRQFRAVGDRA